MINSSPCFEVWELQSKDKGVYISLKNNLNRGELNSVVYFCSLVNKKGRTFSFMTHTRILILLNWKNKPYSIGYIQSMRTLPPWAYLPERKFQKELKIIKTLLVKEKCLEIRFHDDAQSWDLEFQSKAMAKTWIHLIQTHIAIQQNKQSMQKNKRKQKNFKQKTKQQSNSSNLEQQQVYQLMIQEQNLSPRNVISKSTDQPSAEALKDLSLIAKLTSEKEQWLLKQKQLNLEMQLLKRQNAEIKAQNQRFKAINREIKEESARLRIAKSVLTIIKEEYQKKHLQLTQLLAKKSFQIQKLLEKCADIIVLKNNLEEQLYHIKKKAKMLQDYLYYDFQFSSSSNENTKQIGQSQPNLNSKHQIQRHNTQNILIIDQNIKRFSNEGQLVRQNTIC